MTTDRFEQVKSQYRRWPGDTEPNGNWGADVSWLIDEVEALRVQLAERNEYCKLVAEKKQSCRWTYDWYEDTWDTSCGQSFTVIDSTPSQNDMRYCPYCGGVIDEIIEKRALEE